MAQERGNAMMCMTVMLFLLLSMKTSFATTFMVGDASGWDFGVNSWPNGKSFKAGDVLEFTYNRAIHDVMVVDKEAYEACERPISAPRFETGDDLITLKKGDNYFICSFPGHCEGGLKIAVNAA
ncbi:Chemocyanin [Hibiscus syriacus]|uniref:Basic blue protein n=1 Tax=Hibiscus syriacus TaxID=106335 RepID=A0A6A3CMB7_HIBSY|nr:basic blue protein-like [Hibiscus syriacus]KAE8728209.1 Chemocyanin [Hibiscus syriacus]